MSNHLQTESSPYLQQHKNNPVHWFPWCDEAFLKAKEENKAIFISIGYSSCHWCHVMEHEVFEDKGLALKLNKDFICIKVDREERPDIDKFYQEVHLLLNHRAGGWPTSIFATPENKVFFAGTYIPPQTQNNTLGFGELIDIIALKVKEKDETLFSNANEIQGLLKPGTNPNEVANLNEKIADIFVKQADFNFEKSFGGFSNDVKFPQVSMLKGLLDIARLNQNDNALHMCTHTLDNMLLGGFYDLVESGFCRYSTESTWLIPHFEKMTYDNGLLSELYLHAYQATHNETYLNIAKATIDFMLKKMSSKQLFYSASDADSDGIEGKYFVYDYEQSVSLFTEKGFSQVEAEDMCSYLHITPAGNFEGESIIRVDKEKPKGYEKAMKVLQEVRDSREYPFIDEKIIVAWNAMMIKSLFLLSCFDKGYLQQAQDSLEALLAKLYKQGQLYHTCMLDSEPSVTAFLEDYAYLSTALIQAYQSTLNTQYLDLAQILCEKAVEELYEDGKWFFSKGEFITQADISDSSYAGSVGVMVDALLSLGVLVDLKYRHIAFTTLEYYSMKLVKKPNRFPYLFTQALRYVKEDRVLKGSSESLEKREEEFFSLNYPYMLRTLAQEDETLLCGVQSCYTALSSDADLNEELQKTL